MIKLFKSLKPYGIFIGLVLGFTLIQVFMDLLLPTLMADIVNKGIIHQDISYILRAGAMMLGLAAIGGACSIYVRYLSAKIGNSFGRDLRRQVFHKVQDFSMHEFNQVGTASLITRTTNDISQIQNILIKLLRIFVRAPLMVVGGTIMAVTRNPGLSLTLIAVVGILAVAITVLVSKSMPLFKNIQVKLDELNRILRERLMGVRVIRAFNKSVYEKERFKRASYELSNITRQVNKIIALLQPILTFLFNLAVILIVWIGALRVSYGTMMVGDLMAYIQYVNRILHALVMLTMTFIRLPRSAVSATRINEILAIEPQIKDPVDSVKMNRGNGCIRFENVSYKFEGADHYALENISFETKPGETIAIIGGTGAGKSTVVNLLARFYDVTEGAIYIDDIDIREMSQQSLRKRLGIVPQKVLLFSGTIRENIGFGKVDANDEDVLKAARISQSLEFIQQNNDGDKAHISQGGTNLSGGQRQRLSIARALIKEADIYVFDDSFSALDYKTESKLREALKDETGNSTVIVVAQRVSSMMDADQILVLDEGRLVGKGNHTQLMESCEVYRQIIYSQLSEKELAG